MVGVNISPMPLKIIGREACSQAKGLFGLSKDLGPKRRPNIWTKEELQEVRDFMNVEKGNVHRCMK